MKRMAGVLSVMGLLLILSGCNGWDWFTKNNEAEWKGLTANIETYSEEGQIIDQIEGTSIQVTSDNAFAIKDSEGSTVEKSSVLSITIGGKSMVHVGSSLIMYEKGLTNLIAEYGDRISISNSDNSTPFVNRLVNEFRNIGKGESRLIVIKSQSGIPYAAFAGKSVSYFATEIDKSTGLLIDGKKLFVYRSDYTMYDTELLK